MTITAYDVGDTTRRDPVTGTRRRVAGMNLALWRVWMLLFSLGMLAQVGFAGSYLQGTYDAIAWHGITAGILSTGPMLMGAFATLHVLVARGPLWPVLASLGLLAAVFAQIAIAYSRALVVHVPLGVLLVTAVLAMTWWVFSPAARRPGRRWRHRRPGRRTATVANRAWKVAS